MYNEANLHRAIKPSSLQTRRSPAVTQFYSLVEVWYFYPLFQRPFLFPFLHIFCLIRRSICIPVFLDRTHMFNGNLDTFKLNYKVEDTCRVDFNHQTAHTMGIKQTLMTMYGPNSLLWYPQNLKSTTTSHYKFANTSSCTFH